MGNIIPLPKRISYAKSVYAFLKPYIFKYSLALFCYAGQSFMLAYSTSLLMKWVSFAIIEQSYQAVYEAAIYYTFILLAIIAIISWGIYQFNLCVEKAKRDLKAFLFQVFVRMSNGKAGGSHSGQGVAVLNTDANLASQIFGNSLVGLVMSLLSIFFSALAIIVIEWRLGLACIVVGLLGILIQSSLAEPIGRISREKLHLNADLLQQITNFLAGAATIRAFNLEDKVEQNFAKTNLLLCILAYKEAMLSAWQNAFATLQGWLTLLTIFGLGSYMVVQQEMEIATLLMIPSLGQTLTVGMSQIGQAWANYQAPLAAAERLTPYFELVKQSDSKPISNLMHDQVWDGQGDIVFSNLNYFYPGTVEASLKEINLSLSPGKAIAFVGPSGSGKSTLLKVLIGLLENSSKAISLGNVNQSNVNVTDWRRNFSYIDQSCTLFNMSIGENIRLGDLTANDDDIAYVAKQAEAGFIDGLPDAYETACGEKGSQLSGGQKQRIALARALLRKAPILVCDEVTAALDTESELLVIQNLLALRDKQTLLLITHNLSLLDSFDTIVVLDKGRIVASGSHVELYNHDFLYTELYQKSMQKKAGVSE